MGKSDHWKHKMRTYFKRIDFDGDGKVTKADFQGMAERFIEKGNIKDPHATTLRTQLTQVWDDHLVHSAEIAGGLEMNPFVSTMEKVVDDPKMKDVLEGPLPHFFRCVDGNEDGKIDKDEFRLFFEILGLKPELANETFDAIDADRDGLLTETEFITAGTSFFHDDDESLNSKFFWGPLI